MANEFNAGFPARAMANTPQIGAGIVTNPLHLPIAVAEANIMFKAGLTTISPLGTAIPPEYVSAVINTTTLTNVVNISGSGGFVSHIITPIGNTGLIPTVVIVVDGVTYTYTMTAAMISTYRLVLGTLISGNGGTTTSGSAVQQSEVVGIGAFYDAGHSANIGKTLLANNASLPTQHQVATYSMPRLRFGKSLSVSMQMSSIPTATGTYGQYAMVGYTLD